MATLPQDPVPYRFGRVVRVRIPASVAFNLDRFQKFTQNLAERLGCKPCLSGAACLIDVEHSFVVNEKLDLIADTGAVDI